MFLSFCVFACTIIFNTMFVHESVQLYLHNKANAILDTSTRKGRLPSIVSVMLPWKHFPLSNSPFHKSCVAWAYEKNSAGKYKKQNIKIL